VQHVGDESVGSDDSARVEGRGKEIREYEDAENQQKSCPDQYKHGREYPKLVAQSILTHASQSVKKATDQIPEYGDSNEVQNFTNIQTQ
jgi:hypothetical protein